VQLGSRSRHRKYSASFIISNCIIHPSKYTKVFLLMKVVMTSL